MNKPEKLILDYSKWRCGGDGDGINVKGKGRTSLLNEYGFSCCLGQFEQQMGVPIDRLLHRLDPCDLHLHGLNFLIEELPETRGFVNSKLSGDCIDINDNKDTTPEEKIQQLTERLAQEGIQLEVINKP